VLTFALIAFGLALYGDGALLVVWLLDRDFTPYSPKGGTR
jgi:hypothetical protein